jgi:hypothetical protein
MKLGLLILNLMAIIAMFGLSKFCEQVIRSELYTDVSCLSRAELLNEEKIRKTLPNPEKTISAQIVDWLMPEFPKVQFAGLVGYPAMVLFSVNSVILGISIFRERKKNST